MNENLAHFSAGLSSRNEQCFTIWKLAVLMFLFLIFVMSMNFGSANAAVVDKAVEKCGDGTPTSTPPVGSLQENIIKRSEARRANLISNVQTMRSNAIDSFRKNRAQNKQLYGKIFDTYCVDFKLTIYDSLAQLGNWADMWWRLVDAAIQYVLNYVCTVAVDAINSALAQICIPIPNIIPSFSLGGYPQTSCNGLSLNDIVTAVPGRQIALPPVKSLYEDIKRGIGGQPIESPRH